MIMDDEQQSIERTLSAVDNSTFGEGDWNMVIMECGSLAVHWEKMATYLGLNSSSIGIIKGETRSMPSCWNETLSQWIKQNYSTRNHGLPSWKTLLKAVAKIDKLLFQKLAIKHAASGQAARVKVEFERMTTCDKDTPASPEYDTLIKSTPVLKLAVQDHLCLLSGHLLSRHLISTDQDSELRNEMHSEAKRAASLVAMLLNKVKVNPDCYHTFIEVLEGCGDLFIDIVKHLKDTHKSLTSGQASAIASGPVQDKPKAPSLTADGVKDEFMSWLKSKGISDKDCKILKDNEINRKAFQLLDEEDLKNLNLSYGAQKIIKSLLNSSTEVNET